MREVQASEATAHFPGLLDEVEQGETIAITRNGRLVAHLVPASPPDRAKARQVIAEIQAIRQRTEPMSVAEILKARDEGRR